MMLTFWRTCANDVVFLVDMCERCADVCLFCGWDYLRVITPFGLSFVFNHAQVELAWFAFVVLVLLIRLSGFDFLFGFRVFRRVF